MKEQEFMIQDNLSNKRTFSGQIKKSNWKQHLDSHHLLISDFKQFLEPFHRPLFLDRFMGILRFRAFEVAGAKSNLEELQVEFQPPDYFNVKIGFRSGEEIIFEEHTFTIADILAWPVSREPILTTKRLEISLLLPSDEPEIIDFIKDPDVWKMRGERYHPIVNIHSIYQRNNHEITWYKYHFVVRMRQSKKPIGFISFYQLSQPSLITPLISQTPYETVMLSYGLSKFYWGQGIMSESVCAFVPWFIENQTVNELIAFAEINNGGSRRILQKLGLQEYGLLDQPMISSDLKDLYNFIIYKS